MFNWLRKFWNFAIGGGANTPQRRAAARRYLAGDAPGGWASDHYEETVRNTGWNYCAVRALALQFAQAEVYSNVPQIQRLLDRPNPGQSGAVFRFAAAQQFALTGTAFHWFVRNQLGVPVEVYILPTGLTRARGPSQEFPFGSYIVQPQSNLAGFASPDGWSPMSPITTLMFSGAEIDARDVRAMRWPHALYLTDGQSPAAAGALALDLAEQLDRARYYALKNGITPGATIKVPDGLPEEEIEQLEEEVNIRNASPANARRTLLVHDGVSVEWSGQETKEVEYASSYQQARDAVLALHATPPVAVGISEAGSYAQFYASVMQYVELTVQPTLSLWAEEMSEELGSPVIANARRVDDPQVKQSEWDQHARHGVVTVNEYRQAFGLPAVEWGNDPIDVKPVPTLPPEAQLPQQGMQPNSTGAGPI